MPHRCGFFASRSDLLQLLEKIEDQRLIHYVPSGLFDSKVLIRMAKARGIEQLGIAVAGDANHVPAYLIVDASTKVNVREVPQRRGGTKYAVDQLQNPKSIAFSPGGEFGYVAIIAGSVDTVSRDSHSLSLFTLVKKQVQKEFEYINGWYVGKGALEAMDSGIRLTANINSPRECDLRRT